MSKLFDLLSKLISKVNALEQSGEDVQAEVEALKQDIAGIEIGGRNLLLDSDVPFSNSIYHLASYYLGNATPVEGETYTLRLKGQLGEGKEYFWVFNSGSSVLLATLTDNGDGTYSATFPWTNTKGTTTVEPTHIRVYAAQRDVETVSTIEWIKLEAGSHATSWTPAPEDNTSDEFLVTVEVDSLTTEALTSDKNYAEIEGAILAGKNVRVKLISSSVADHIYLQMVSHTEGSEIAFCGYFDNLPLLLKITA